jgi:hypothetical protein
MTHSINRLCRIALSVVSGVACLFLSENFSPLTKPKSLVTSAEARIGRPLTPMSYAGVARRTTRRAVVGGAAVGAAAAGTYYGAGCVQATNAYGQIVTRCP